MSTGPGVEFVGVDIWDDLEGAQRFLAEEEQVYPSGPDTAGAIVIDYGVRGIPENFHRPQRYGCQEVRGADGRRVPA